MKQGKPFEVSKEVYDRAREAANNKEQTYYFMTARDREELFDLSITCGYGLYSCMVHEENGKYICTWVSGDSCD